MVRTSGLSYTLTQVPAAPPASERYKAPGPVCPFETPGTARAAKTGSKAAYQRVGDVLDVACDGFDQAIKLRVRRHVSKFLVEHCITCSQFAPPSVDRYTPPKFGIPLNPQILYILLSLYQLVGATSTKTRFGSTGSTSIVVVKGNQSPLSWLCFHVVPPSVLRHVPITSSDA